jgi:hypothetical protein
MAVPVRDFEFGTVPRPLGRFRRRFGRLAGSPHFELRWRYDHARSGNVALTGQSGRYPVLER